MLIDTHAHLWFDDYKDDLESVIKKAKAVGVEKMIAPGTGLESSRKAVELAKRYPGVIYGAVGIHPEEIVKDNSSEETPFAFVNPYKVRPSALDMSRGWALPSRSDLPAAVAIGEIGTDASTEELRGCMDTQKALFKEQCEMALEYKLPVIIHTRESLNEALEILDQLPSMPKGQFHCFSHDEEGIKKVLSRGFYLSFCGNITWSKRVAKLVNLVPDDRLLLETDSPFMKPRITDERARQALPLQNRNEPADVRVLAEIIAELRGQNMEIIERITTENAMRLFRL